MSSTPSPVRGWAQRWIGQVPVPDLVAALLLALGTFVLCYRAADWDVAQYKRSTAWDIWFDADVHRVYNGETDRLGGTDRTTLHPLYGYLTFPPLYVFRKLTGISQYTSVRIFHSAVAALWMSLFYGLLRRIRLRRADALVVTGMTASSAMCVFWLPATETFVIGSLSIFPALWLSAGPPTTRRLPHFLSSTLALGVTITNWLAALVSSYLDLPRRTFLRVNGGALAVCLLFGYAYRWVFPASRTLFEGAMHEAAWVFCPESGGPFAVMRVFFFSGMVAPEIRFVDNWRQPAWPLMTMQFGGLMSATRWSWLATPVWAALLAMGGYAMARLKDFPRLRTVMTVALLYQFLLHLIYGRETFLYTMHFLPMMILGVALALHTRLRPLVLALALLLTVANLMNNTRQFSWARSYAGRHAALKSQEDEIRRLTPDRRQQGDPTYQFRFWRDVWPGPSRT
jgi:hypothetical protein